MHPIGADFHLTSVEIYALQQVACSNTSVGWVFDWPSGISPYYTEYIYVYDHLVLFFLNLGPLLAGAFQKVGTRPRPIIKTFINSNTWNHTQPKGKKM
jgi:hypothetical protein